MSGNGIRPNTLCSFFSQQMRWARGSTTLFTTKNFWTSNLTWFKYYKLAFAVRSIIYGSLLLRFWAKAKYGFNVQHVMVVQAYAYLTAIKDRLLGIELLWAASGNRKAHKRNKYRNMGILYWLWTIVNFGGVVAAVTYYWLLSRDQAP
ncbi:hypothetical protein L209DRAFT_741324 [Thermothelomyces heterothallicus CBS 203.75]